MHGAGNYSSDNLNGTMSMVVMLTRLTLLPLLTLKKRAIETGAEISAITLDSGVNSAVQSLLRTADVTIVFLHTWATEGFDRDIELDPHMDDLVAAAVGSSSNVVVVMHILGVVDVEKWNE
ncbi:hypothetical protein VKT23_015145 [Stygiomarasmius scandens]|uniref:beta-glucosidase n=1 Tax=Marasmiellus scandens TaxID=2682957 RepID=A0ABR1J398_9AGAR